MSKPVDSIQQRLADYACSLTYADLSTSAIHAAKVRVIDTLGSLMGGFDGEPCRLARNLAAQMPMPSGATIIGTRTKTTPDMAAFVNSTTSRYVEMNDVYHWPGSSGGHPSDMLLPVLAIGEYAAVSGRDFLTGVALAYEVYLRIADAVSTPGFDSTNFACLGTAVAAGTLLGLSHEQLSQCISMAVVPNNALGQSRTGHLSMWKAVAAGQAGRSGVFAALLAREGMAGPNLPFEGTSGWCAYVSRERFSLDTMGGNGTSFKVQDTLIKPRSSCATTISSILAAEKVAARLKGIEEIEQVTVEVYERAKVGMGTGEHHWNPDSRETADHSIPYVVAAALMDGTVTPRQFDNDHLWNPELRALLQKIAVVSNPAFTAAYERLPVEHRTRITAVTRDGQAVVGEAGGNQGDLSEEKDDAQIEAKFYCLTEAALGTKQVRAILDCLWHLDDMCNVADIPRAFVR